MLKLYYRFNFATEPKKPNQMELESSKISANAIIEKIIQD
ncbi:hypothetical protein HMPREF9973_07623 [Staphylococcus epidermidis NIH05001]|uniref:Uncharacterized protein n=1 Tax=Staphylococcus epidermidis TaxID=1282 RepID=A0A169SYF4_STAEP|nr:hypothetical protein HMPREF9973_07623 [Staphylococcus epidermidis NIH05001]BAU98156.1 hypothetical protein [Staphylococcus epidermidis]